MDVANVGCDGLGLDMAIVPLVHAKHGSSLEMRCKSNHGRKDKLDITVIYWRQKLNLHSLDFVVIQSLEYIPTTKHLYKLSQRLYNASRLLRSRNRR